MNTGKQVALMFASLMIVASFAVIFSTDSDADTTTISVENYEELKAALDTEATDGCTIEITQDISVDTWTQIWSVSDVKDITIDGKDHTLKANSVYSNGNHNAFFLSKEGWTIRNIVFDMSESTQEKYRFIDVGTSNTLENITAKCNNNGSAFVIPSTDTTVIRNCNFHDCYYGVYDSLSNSTTNLTIEGCTFDDCEYATILYSSDSKFVGNIVTDSKVNVYKGTPVVTGNTFDGTCRIKFNTTGADFSKNSVSQGSYLAFDDGIGDSKVDISDNYWGGGEPSSEQLRGNGDKIICNTVWTPEDEEEPSVPSLPPVIDDENDDELPFIPGNNTPSQSTSGSDKTTVVAAAAAVVVIMLAVVALMVMRKN